MVIFSPGDHPANIKLARQFGGVVNGLIFIDPEFWIKFWYIDEDGDETEAEYEINDKAVRAAMPCIDLNRLKEAIERKTNKYFLLDEMLLLPRLEHLSESLNFGCSLGVRMMCGLQNTCGLEEQYGEVGARNILSSFQNMVAFRLNDYDTRQFVINRLGENYQNFSLSVQQANLNIQRAGHTVEDWNLLKLNNGEAVVSLVGEDLFLFAMPLYG